MNNRSRADYLLAAVAVLLLLNLISLVVGGGVSTALAAQPDRNRQNPDGEIFNATEQRKRMIEQLQQLNEKVNTLNDRVSKLDARIEKGISVKVTEMPVVKIEDKGK